MREIQLLLNSKNCKIFQIRKMQKKIELTTTTENRSLFLSSSEVDFVRETPPLIDEWIDDVDETDELEDACDVKNWSNSLTLSSASRVSSLAMEYSSPNLLTRSAGRLSMPFDAL